MRSVVYQEKSYFEKIGLLLPPSPWQVKSPSNHNEFVSKAIFEGKTIPGLFFAHFQKTQGHLQKNSSPIFSENSILWRQLIMLGKKLNEFSKEL